MGGGIIKKKRQRTTEKSDAAVNSVGMNQTKHPTKSNASSSNERDNTGTLAQANKEKATITKAVPQSKVPPPPPPPQPQSMMTFENFCTPRRFSKGVLQYIQHQKFQYMTPVQIATIPQFLNHKDVAVQSVTGSGKTLAFVIPIIELLLQSKITLKSQQIGALILSPTRELAQQTYNVTKDICSFCQQPEPLLLVGGGNSSSGGGGGGSNSTSSSSSSNARPVTMDIQTFQKLGSNIVIGTPGRVNDILSRYAVIDCNELICFVLDEADVLLNMGFTMTLQSIMSYLPKMRRTALFSATQSSSTSTTLSEWMQRVGMRNPVWIDVTIVAPNTIKSTSSTDNTTLLTGSSSQQSTVNAFSDGTNTSSDVLSSTKTTSTKRYQATPLSLQNYYIVTKMDEKISRLATFLYDHATLKNEKIIVFFLTCACVDYYGTIFQQLFNPPSSKNNNNNNSKIAKASSKNAANEKHIVVEMLHGKMVQKRREKTMERFRMSCESRGNDNEGDDDAEKDQKHTNGIVLFCTDVAARGLDVSDIQWVVQMDAPQDPSFFIHRVGRCARANKIGQSLLFVTPKEESYIDFLHMRNIPIEPLPSTERCCPPSSLSLPDVVAHHGISDNGTSTRRRLIYGSSGDETPNSVELIDDLLPKIVGLVTTDRDMLEKGTKAYTSYVRAYKEHHCAFIFRFASLDLGLLATSFCLLRLPKMPELRDILQKHKGSLPNFTPAGRDIDIFAIPFKDKAREQARQKRLQEELAAGGKNAKRIEAERRKAEKEQKDHERRQKALEKGRNPDKKRGRQAQLVDEWEDLAKEERLVKKLRRGKLTKDEFNEQMKEV